MRDSAASQVFLIYDVSAQAAVLLISQAQTDSMAAAPSSRAFGLAVGLTLPDGHDYSHRFLLYAVARCHAAAVRSRSARNAESLFVTEELPA
jgi:hypothetical protein